MVYSPVLLKFLSAESQFHAAADADAAAAAAAAGRNFVRYPDRIDDHELAAQGHDSTGSRRKIDPDSLLESAAELITTGLNQRGFRVTVTKQQVKELPLRVDEVIALRLYTGPMFEL